MNEDYNYAAVRLRQCEREIKQSQSRCGTCHEPAISGTPCSNKRAEHYWDGTGQFVLVHSKAACKFQPCVIHAPSPHKMRGFRTHWRADRKLMERICPHGVGHPDPDDLSFKKVFMSSAHVDAEAIHGCDGCCDPKLKP